MKAPQVPRYATRVPGRSAGEFKPHNTLAQAKQALLMYPNLRRLPRESGQSVPRSVFRLDMELLRLDSDQGEYLPWVAFKEGTSPGEYPELANGYSDPNEKYLTERTAAFLLGVKRTDVRRMARHGELEPVNVDGRSRFLRSDVEALKAAREISAHYGGQPAPVPDGLTPLSEEEAQEARDYGEQLKAPLSQATVDALNERLASGDYPRRVVTPVKITERPEPQVSMCGTLPGPCQVDEGLDQSDEDPADIERKFNESTRGGVTAPTDATEGQREFPLGDEEIEQALEGSAAPVTYVIAYNWREYFQWCAENGYDYQRTDWAYAHDPRWLLGRVKRREGPFQYLLTPRAAERRDWPELVKIIGTRDWTNVTPALSAREQPNERTRSAVGLMREVIARPPKTLRQVRQVLADAVVDLAQIERSQRENPVPPAVYPLTLIASRYRGTYEGASWVAFNDYPERLDGAMGDDVTCVSFFRMYERFKPIGRGETPQEAIRDLARQVKP